MLLKKQVSHQKFNGQEAITTSKIYYDKFSGVAIRFFNIKYYTDLLQQKMRNAVSCPYFLKYLYNLYKIIAMKIFSNKKTCFFSILRTISHKKWKIFYTGKFKTEEIVTDKKKNQMCIQNPVKHLRRKFCKNSSQFSAVNYLHKQLHFS